MIRRLNGRAGTLAVLALLAALAVAPFLSAYYTSVLLVIGIHTILTVGLCLLMGYAGQVSLGHAAFYGIGAFVSGVLTATYHVNPWLAMAIAAAGTGLVAYAVSFPIFQLRGNYLAMATLGFGIIIYVLFVEMDKYTGGPSGLSGVPYLSIGGLVFNTDFKLYYLIWGFTIAVLLISLNIVNSRSGRAMRAIQANEAAARSVGINVAGYKVKVFVLAAVYASLAGSLYVHYLTFVSPQPFGFLFSVRLVVMAVVGGLASVWGAIFGTAGVTFLGDALSGIKDLDIILFGLLLIVVMVFLPQGLFRGLVEAYERFRARPRRTGRR